MYLKRLELKGFKSFPTKTDILFNEGITAIVGPNGSGKSNISDAVRWVLGEQSIKSLRGEKLEDVIFAGTDTKKAMNYCEVALTIDNSDNKLDLDFNEITIKRRAYRNGESSFFLNNKSCRLKDIKEILLDTGIGKDGYSIIEQGKVDEILSNNPANRRKVFDEACGISKFRYKKQEAEKNLRNTKENLERINDIYIEIENQLKPLFIQQEKANKYLEISEKLKIIEVNSYIREIEELERELNEINKHSQLLENQLIETEKQKELAENGFNDTNKEIDDINESISKAQDYINSINSVISKKDSQINIINERIKNHKNEIERCIKEAEEIKEKIKFNNNSLKELQDSKINNEDKINSLNKDIESLNKLNLNKKEEIDSINTELENLKDDIINILNKKQEASSKLSTLTANMDNINSRTETIDLDINEINKELNQKNEHLKECNQNFDSKNINLEKVKNRYEENIVQLKELNELSENLDKNIQDNKYKLNNYNSKLTVYVEMENHNEGFNKGVKEVLKNKSLRGIHGALGQVISVSQKYEKAIESVLGAYMQNIITDDENSAKMAINYLKQNNLGRVTFLPLSIIKSNKINLNNIKSNTNCIGVASDLLSYDEKYKNILENILGRTIVIDTIDNGIKFAKETGHKYKVVTLDGEILNPGGSLTGGSFRTNANILSRKRLINEYSEKIKIKENEIKTLLSKKEEYNQKNSSLKNNIIDLELDIKNIDKDIIIQGSKINRIEDEIKVLKQNLNKLQNEKDGLKLNQNITIERTNSVKKEIDSLENNHKTNKDRILKLTTQVKESSGTYENDKVKHDSLNLELAKYNQVYENILSEINRINNENIELELKLNNTEEVLKQQQIETSKLEENIIIEQTEKLSLNKQLGDNIRNLENKKVVKESLKQKLEDTNKDVKQ
ncbi:Chromosome partition protein Smc [Romboutsia lituseburensis]|nr:chromosome segregation protein SMC [Romboutsia lituseburensis]CEH35353.1 Chromosome partition protein Smc [Romboutsia lituseburensis]